MVDSPASAWEAMTSRDKFIYVVGYISGMGSMLDLIQLSSFNATDHLTFLAENTRSTVKSKFGNVDKIKLLIKKTDYLIAEPEYKDTNMAEVILIALRSD